MFKLLQFAHKGEIAAGLDPTLQQDRIADNSPSSRPLPNLNAASAPERRKQDMEESKGAAQASKQHSGST